MKILIMSDSHWNRTGLEKIIKSNADADEIVFLGDGAEYMDDCMEKIPALKQKSVRIVRGNCDGFSEKPAEVIFDAAGHKFLCTHGHYQSVKRGFERIYEEACEKGCDIVLYGHTHIADFSDDYPGVKLFNPGAVLENCYGVVTIDEKTGEADFLHKTIRS